MKKVIIILLTLVLICIFYTSTIAASYIKVILDDDELFFDSPPQLINGRTMVPLRAIFEAMGAHIDWNGYTQTVTAVKDDTIVVLTIGNTSPTINKQIVKIDQPGIIINGRTFAPLRFVAEAFGGTVDWNDKTQTAYISMYLQSTSGNAEINNDKLLFRSSNKNRCIINGNDLAKGVTLNKVFEFKNPNISTIEVLIKRGSPNGTDIILMPYNKNDKFNINYILLSITSTNAFNEMDELNYDYSIQIDIIDLDNNGYDEIVVSIGDFLIDMETYVFNYINDDEIYGNYIMPMDSIWGQKYIEFDEKGIITIPYGSFGLFDEYVYGVYQDTYAFTRYE